MVYSGFQSCNWEAVRLCLQMRAPALPAAPGAALESEEEPNAAPLCGSLTPLLLGPDTASPPPGWNQDAKKGFPAPRPRVGSSGVGVDQSPEGDFCLAGAIHAFRGGAMALCLRQSLLTSQCVAAPPGRLQFSVEPGLTPGL